jgi:hypothetical protein
MKPISATKSNICDYCETIQVKDLAGKDCIKYICSLQENPVKCSKPCTMRDWARCEKNEDK